jgi:hypothetical protein
MKANATGGIQTLLIENGIPYQIHTFTSSGVLTTSLGGPIQCLVVAGGGGGGFGRTGNHTGGGGGAGGVKYVEDLTLNSGQSYVVTVGSGASPFLQGSGSAFAELVSTTGGGGGGGGGGANGFIGGIGPTGGGNGGSGGGGSGNHPGGTGIAGEGFAGAVGGTDLGGGGGGGGAGAQGIRRESGGGGGVGRSFSISGSSNHYGGGGGFGANSLGGLGGGGKGAKDNGTTASADLATSGQINTGGGGGGGAPPNGIVGGTGGSGIVIVRYIVVGLAVSSNDLTAGDTLVVSLFTENIADNTVVPYTISGIESSDINGAALTGNFIISSNFATVSFLITTPSKQTKTITIESNGSAQTISIIENRFGLSLATSASVLLAFRAFIDIDFASRTSFNAAEVADFDPPQYWVGA